MKNSKKIFAFLLSICFILPICQNITKLNFANAEEIDETVNVPDINLKRGFLSVIRALNGNHTPVEKSDAQAYVFKKSELSKIKSLSPEVCTAHNPQEGTVKILDLTGIEYCKDIEKLSLVNQRITDISLLKGLVKLESLDLRNNSEKDKAIEDISALGNLTKLKTLNLNQSRIADTKPLENLVNMEHLSLFGTRINNIDFVENMPNLKYADLSYEKLKDISALENCKKLEILKLETSPRNDVQENFERISDISALGNLVELRELTLGNNDIEDISILKNLKNLTKLDLNHNKISNFEVLFTLPNLNEVFVSGNAVELENKTENFRKAKSYYEKLSKDELVKEDIKTIEELLAEKDNVKNYFSKETLKKFDEYKNSLKNSDSIKNELFKDIKTEEVNGELIKIFNKKLTTTIGGDVTKKLPNMLKVQIQKDKEQVVGKVEKDKQGYDVLKFAIINEKGELITEAVNFKTSTGKEITSENGYLTIDRTSVPVVWMTTTVNIQSEKFEMEKSLTLEKHTMQTIRCINGEDLSGLSETELGKKLVIVIRAKGSVPIVPPEPPKPQPNPDVPKPNPGEEPENPKPTETKKAGIDGNKLYLKVVDENGKIIKKDGLFKFESDYESVTTTLEEDLYLINLSGSEYTYNIKMNSNDYTLIGNYSFVTKYDVKTFKGKLDKIDFNGESKSFKGLSDEEIKNLDEKYFTIKVKNNNPSGNVETPDVPKTEPAQSVKGEFKINTFNDSLKFAVVDKNGKLITDKLTFDAGGETVVSENGYVKFDINEKNKTYNIKLVGNDYKLIHDFSFKSNPFKNILYNVHWFDKVENKYIDLPIGEYQRQGIKDAISEILVLEVEKSTSPLTPKSLKSNNTNDFEVIPVEEALNVDTNEKTDIIETFVPVKWDFSTLGTTAGTYTVYGELTLPKGVRNSKNLKAKAVVVLKEKVEKPTEEDNEVFGELKESTKDILKIAIIDKDFKLVKEPVVFSDKSNSYMSKDGYIEVEVKNGVNTFEIQKEGYGISKNIVYTGLGTKLMDINGKFLNEISELGLKRQLRIQIGELKTLKSEDGKVTVVSPNITDKMNLKSEKVENNFELLKDRDVNIFDINIENSASKEKIDFTNGSFTVTIEKEKGKTANKVYYINERENKLEELEFTQDEKTVTFKTTHFSKYAIVYENSEKPDEPNNPNKPDPKDPEKPEPNKPEPKNPEKPSDPSNPQKPEDERNKPSNPEKDKDGKIERGNNGGKVKTDSNNKMAKTSIAGASIGALVASAVLGAYALKKKKTKKKKH